MESTQRRRGPSTEREPVSTSTGLRHSGNGHEHPVIAQE
jgi:hypothetical protein